MRAVMTACLVGLPGYALALELVLSGASTTLSESIEAGSVRVPEAPWSADAPAPLVEGDIIRTVLNSPGGTRTTLQLLAPLRDQLSAAGFDTVFSCADQSCGGFDFRSEMDILGAPEMFVDLGDFRYFLARRDRGEPHTVSIVTSRSSGTGFVHITEVREPTLSATALQGVSAVTNAIPPDEAGSQGADIIITLVEKGHVVLGDLEFESGSATLETKPFESLSALAQWLSDNDTARVALVGHTDNIGSNEGNRILSQRRAETVRTRLIEVAGIDPSRIEAAGVGYLSPLGPNSTEDGRALNRRVEAVLLSGG